MSGILANRKVWTIHELRDLLARLRAEGKRLVQCHGDFDLLHVGQIKHLAAAKDLGDVLFVTLTPDRFINKGPHRPLFSERLRAESVAALGCVDFVAINEWPTAVEAITMLRPTHFARGMVRELEAPHVPDAIDDEERAVVAVGGKICFTNEDSFSASTLINRFMSVFSPAATQFLEDFRAHHSPDEVIGYLQRIRNLKVLVVGETIIDEYQFCSTLGKSSKEPILAALLNRTERYAGGAVAVANHLSNFCDHIQLISMLGSKDSGESLVRSTLNSNVSAHFLRLPEAPTITKRRFLEEHLSAKLFEVYVMRNEHLPPPIEDQFLRSLEGALPDIDVVVVADYGHGLLTERAVDLVCTHSKFLAVNAQVNAGNRGFNLITKYPRADFVALGEPELRLDARNPNGGLQPLVQAAAERIGSRCFLVTQGSSGCSGYHSQFGAFEVPAFAVRVVDRIGAGDAVFALASPCVAVDTPPKALGFISNVVGAEACMIMGHSRSIEPGSLFQHIASLMK